MTRRFFALIGVLGALTITMLMLVTPRSATAATPAAPAAPTYLVTSSSNAAITTCAGGANDCSLRGAVQLANASASGASIYFSSTITLVTLNSPITLTHNNIGIYGNGHEVTRLKTNGNFPALVIQSNNNVINSLWINATGNHAGANQHGILINSNGNIISANSLSDLGGDGILIQNGSNNWIYGNFIGVQTHNGTPWSMCGFKNDLWGILIVDSPSNDIDSNTIGCNTSDGIGITGANSTANTLHGNYIGVVDWNAPVPNTLAGVALWGGAHANLIGDPATQGNTIAGNQTWGVYIGGTGTNSNLVQLNTIGLTATTPISNAWGGVLIQTGAQQNQLLTNTIEFNGANGVYINGDNTNSNRLYNNSLRANGVAGVVIDGGAAGNSIGMAGNRAYGNAISANASDGIYIGGATTRYNVIAGNYIGTNKVGNTAAPNLHSGIVLDSGTYGNQIGGFVTDRNVIAGNAWDGVLIINGAHDNSVQSNDIGTNRDVPSAANTAAPDRPAGGGGSYIHLPNGGGISIIGSYTNTIGASIGAAQVDNFISYNTHTGIYLAYGSQHNLIGSNLVRANGDYGVLLDGTNPVTSTAYNTISRTQILESGLDGIGERGNAGLNVWSEVAIHSNGGLGIDKSANDDGQNLVTAPHNFGIDAINRATGVVHGHADASVLGTVKIELYRVALDPSGFGEGSIFVGSTTTDTSGNWTITDPTPAQGSCYTAFVTESQLVIPFSSSEFSANTCRVMLPLTIR